jgi:predicted nicotinamide N-methyase
MEQLRVEQRPFGAEGFASTVWDSSIVMAKYLERHAPQFAGKRCLELGAGCGLVGACLPSAISASLNWLNTWYILCPSSCATRAFTR